MTQAIDFKKYWLRREGRKLAKEVAELADSSVAWNVSSNGRAFLTQHELSVLDLLNILRTASKVVPSDEANQMLVYGSTVDEVLAAIFIRVSAKTDPPLVELLGGRMFADEEDLVG